MKFERNPKHDQEATEHGLTLLGVGKNSLYRMYQFVACGHE